MAQPLDFFRSDQHRRDKKFDVVFTQNRKHIRVWLNVDKVSQITARKGFKIVIRETCELLWLLQIDYI